MILPGFFSIFSWLRYERRTVRKRRPLPQEWPLQVPAWLLWPHLLQARQHHRLVATGFRCQGEQDRQNSPHSEISERQLIVVIYRVDIYKKKVSKENMLLFFFRNLLSILYILMAFQKWAKRWSYQFQILIKHFIKVNKKWLKEQSD